MNKNNLNTIIILRHELYKIPELSMMESKTGDRIFQFLKDQTMLQAALSFFECRAHPVFQMQKLFRPQFVFSAFS